MAYISGGDRVTGDANIVKVGLRLSSNSRVSSNQSVRLENIMLTIWWITAKHRRSLAVETLSAVIRYNGRVSSEMNALRFVKFARAGVLYFVIVFGTGFVLGTLRVLFLVPSVGVRTAELLEAPIMLVVSFLAARFVTKRMKIPPTVSDRLGVGIVGFVFMLAAEFGLVLWLRGVSISEYFASRDPIAGTVYYLTLLLFALMPLLVRSRSS